jgi:Nitrogenase subunit NifH (ATPase)
MRGIAFYGKGGIGKSTTISNVIAALTAKGRKILLIGCDPKHDSTRLLLGGFTQTTVLEQLNTTGVVSLETVMLTGFSGVKCIESGGPEPGVGCAGRGIIQTLQLLKAQGLDTNQFDYVFFDVLGDVVCGGFAVPMREGYADEVFIVTSGEIASLYAANNISKGLKHFATLHGKLAGIIGNERCTKNERCVIDAFSRKIGTEMVAFIPRSELISQAELLSKTIMEVAPDSALASVYLSIADYIESHPNPVIPASLSDAELDNFLHEFCYDSELVKRAKLPQTVPTHNDTANSISKVTSASVNTQKCIEKNHVNAVDREPVHGCSLSGAFNVISQIGDALALMYSPQGCSYLSFCTHLHQSWLPGSESLYLPNLLCTNMNETDVVFGGAKSLEKALYSIQKRFPTKTVFLITSCPTGLIGDDIKSSISRLTSEKQKVLHIPSDGVMGGDFYSGMLNAYQLVAEQFIDDTITPEKDAVNLIGEQNLSTTANLNFQAVSQILNDLGVKINCRFIRETCLDEITNFKKAKVNIPMINESTVHALTVYLDNRFGTKTLAVPPPVAFKQTSEFTRAIAQCFGKELAAEKLIQQATLVYEQELSSLRPFFAGKKALIFNTYGGDIEWLLSTLIDLEVETSQLALTDFAYNQERPVPLPNTNIQILSSIAELQDAIHLNRPDFVLTNGGAQTIQGVSCDSFPILPMYGFNTGFEYAKKLAVNLKILFNEGWRQDEKLF